MYFTSVHPGNETMSCGDLPAHALLPWTCRSMSRTRTRSMFLFCFEMAINKSLQKNSWNYKCKIQCRLKEYRRYLWKLSRRKKNCGAKMHSRFMFVSQVCHVCRDFQRCFVSFPDDLQQSNMTFTKARNSIGCNISTDTICFQIRNQHRVDVVRQSW